MDREAGNEANVSTANPGTSLVVIVFTARSDFISVTMIGKAKGSLGNNRHYNVSIKLVCML